MSEFLLKKKPYSKASIDINSTLFVNSTESIRSPIYLLIPANFIVKQEGGGLRRQLVN
jgi:hypothetical protein